MYFKTVRDFSKKSPQNVIRKKNNTQTKLRIRQISQNPHVTTHTSASKFNV